MFSGTLLISFAYLGILFAIAYYGDKRASSGRSIVANPYIYTLSIAIYCTAWTFYGSVGRATVSGIGFLPTYLGPTLIAILWWLVLRKIVRIAKKQHITSISDFVSSRYGKSALLGGLVATVSLVGITPYIALQIKAISATFNIVVHYPHLHQIEPTGYFWTDSAFYLTLLLTVFTILFGTRHIDATERHEGMIAAIAFESLVKLIAFLTIGVFVTFVLFSSPYDLFSQALAVPELQRLLTMDSLASGYSSWVAFCLISLTAIMFLPRQFHVLVVENTSEEHIKTASWLFPLYMLAITLFTLPIAFGGYLLLNSSGVNPDTYVLTLPLTHDAYLLVLFAYLGGLSAATSMIAMEAIVLSTMICNDLVMPLLLRIKWLKLSQWNDLTKLLLGIRRIMIVLGMLSGYLYFRLVGDSAHLVSIGLISFVAVAQFAPSIFIGLYWKGANRTGAMVGLFAGFVCWIYTLMLPSFATSGWLSTQFIETGLFGIALLKPYSLFGLDFFDPITHAVFWSLFFNLSCLVGFSLFSKPSVIEQAQAIIFVDVFSDSSMENRVSYHWGIHITLDDLQALLSRFLGEMRAKHELTHYLRTYNLQKEQVSTDYQLVEFAERLLAGVIGSASARIIIETTVKGQQLSVDGVMQILEETSQMREYSRHLEEKSKQLEEENLRLNAEIQVARRLQQMLLPKEYELKQVEELDVAGFMEPAENVGGDYYDVLQRGQRVKISIGDVTGHGLESGVFALIVQTAVHTLLENDETDKVKFLNTLNRVFYHATQRMGIDKDSTLVLLDYIAGRVKITGQHEDVIFVRQSGEVSRISTNHLGFPLGLEEDIAHFIDQVQIHLHPGDGIVLFTDGITEARSEHNKFYGTKRLCEIIQCNWHYSAEAIKVAIVEDLHQFIGQAKILDDITLVVLKQR